MSFRRACLDKNQGEMAARGNNRCWLWRSAVEDVSTGRAGVALPIWQSRNASRFCDVSCCLGTLKDVLAVDFCLSLFHQSQPKRSLRTPSGVRQACFRLWFFCCSHCSGAVVPKVFCQTEIMGSGIADNFAVLAASPEDDVVGDRGIIGLIIAGSRRHGACSPKLRCHSNR